MMKTKSPENVRIETVKHVKLFIISLHAQVHSHYEIETNEFIRPSRYASSSLAEKRFSKEF